MDDARIAHLSGAAASVGATQTAWAATKVEPGGNTMNPITIAWDATSKQPNGR
jgi:hypothetical protein